MSKKLLMVSIIAVVAALSAPSLRLQAAGGDAPAEPIVAPLHGGQVSRTPAGDFETVFAPDGVRVYLYTAEGAPAMVEGAGGSAVITRPGGKPVETKLAMEVPAKGEDAVYFCPMHAEVVQRTPGECAKCGGMKLYVQNRLFGKTDLKAPAGSIRAEVTIGGLPGEGKQATFTVSNLAPIGAPPAQPGKQDRRHGTAPPKTGSR